MAEGLLLNRSRQVPAEETPAFGGIAERFRRAGDLDRAIALCQEGLQRFPNQLSARVTLGWSLLDKGQYDEARAELEYVLRRAPDNLAAIRGLAQLHDRADSAMPSMEGGGAWHPSNEEASHAAPQPSLAVPAATAEDAPLVLESPAQALLAAAGASEIGATPVPLREDIAEEWLQHEAAAGVGPKPAPIDVQPATALASQLVVEQEVFESPAAALSIETPAPAPERLDDVISSVSLDLDLGESVLDPVLPAAASLIEPVAPALLVDPEPYRTSVSTPAGLPADTAPAVWAAALRHALLTSEGPLASTGIDDVEDWPSELDPELPPAAASAAPVALAALSDTDPLEALGIALPLASEDAPVAAEVFDVGSVIAEIVEGPFASEVDTPAADSFMLKAQQASDPAGDALLAASLGMSAESIAALDSRTIDLPLLNHIDAQITEPEASLVESEAAVATPEIPTPVVVVDVAALPVSASAAVGPEPASVIEPEVDDDLEIRAPAAAVATPPPARAGVLVMSPRGSEPRSPVAALERFLRKVHTRRLQLTSGSVA